MNNKVLVGIVAVVVIIVAVAAIGLGMNGNDNGGDHGADTVIIYDGNGGTSFNDQHIVESNVATVSTMGFSYGDRVFLSWNTSADGTGTSYSEGMTVSAMPGDPITLYAQWGYTLNISMLNLASSTLTPMFLSSTSQFVITGLFDVVPDSGHVFIYVQSNVELQWITEDGSNTFTAQNGNDEYTVTFGYTSGVENVQYFLDIDGNPVMAFDIVGWPNVSLDMIHRHIS